MVTERQPDPRDMLTLDELNKKGFTPYALRRWAEAVWKPGKMRDSLYGFADQWERDVQKASIK